MQKHGALAAGSPPIKYASGCDPREWLTISFVRRCDSDQLCIHDVTVLAPVGCDSKRRQVAFDAPAMSESYLYLPAREPASGLLETQTWSSTCCLQASSSPIWHCLNG